MTPRIGRQLSTFSAIFILLSSSAYADTILPTFDGTISFASIGDSPTPVDENGDATGLGDAVGIDFDTGEMIIVSKSTGDFGDIVWASVLFYDFFFSPSAPADPLWEIVFDDFQFSFAVDVFSIVAQSSTGLTIQGTGNLSATGYSDTAGTWSLSMDTANPEASDPIFGWSSTSASTVTVPEPGTLALLGLGLLGLGFSRRRSAVAA